MEIVTIEIRKKIHRLNIFLIKCQENLMKCDRRYNETFISIGAAVNLLNEMKEIVIENSLKQWKHNQIMAIDLTSDKLDEIQNWLEQLVIINLKMIDMVKAMRSDKMKYNEKIENLNDELSNILQSLISSSFIVEAQPEQVIKKDTRFVFYLFFLGRIVVIFDKAIWSPSFCLLKSYYLT